MEKGKQPKAIQSSTIIMTEDRSETRPLNMVYSSMSESAGKLEGKPWRLWGYYN